jgi:hypothetical protein
MPSLAAEVDSPMGESGGLARAVRFVDVAVLAAALPVFVLAELPLLAYGVIAGVWLGGLAIEIAGERSARRRLQAGDRHAAMGLTAATGLGRVWLVTLTVLLLGVLDERDTGLAAAVLAAILFTVHMGGRLVSGLLLSEDRAR